MTMSNAETNPTHSIKGARPLTNESSIVDALNDVFGKQSQTRARAHAKGIVVAGTFTPSVGGALISVAPHLQNAPVPPSVRVSNFSGVPTTPDTDGSASPRGMALRFHLPDGSTTDIVSHSFDGFPCATADEVRALFVALGTCGPGVASPGPISFMVSVRNAACGVSNERQL